MPSRRQAQLATQIQRLAAQSLVGVALPSLLTVTRATISPDARQATIWLAGWDALTEKDQAAVRGAVVEVVVRGSQTKFTPRLKFADDDAAAYAAQVQALLKPDSE